MLYNVAGRVYRDSEDSQPSGRPSCPKSRSRRRVLPVPRAVLNAQLAHAGKRSPDTYDKPNLTAALQRAPGGKPDLSGVWRPEVNPYRFDVIQDLKDEGIFRPQAEAVFLKRVADFPNDDPVTNPPRAARWRVPNGMYRIKKSPTVVAVLKEIGHGKTSDRFTDMGALPPQDQADLVGLFPVGHWEGDAIVVVSPQGSMIGLARSGHPLIPRAFASPRGSGVSISDTCSFRSPMMIPKH